MVLYVLRRREWCERAGGYIDPHAEVSTFFLVFDSVGAAVVVGRAFGRGKFGRDPNVKFKYARSEPNEEI